jgi:hypothetical protein
MNWLLVVVVAGAPVPTNLVYPNLGACMNAEQQMRAEHVALYNSAMKQPGLNDENRRFMASQIPHGTCIPTK